MLLLLYAIDKSSHDRVLCTQALIEYFVGQMQLVALRTCKARLWPFCRVACCSLGDDARGAEGVFLLVCLQVVISKGSAGCKGDDCKKDDCKEGACAEKKADDCEGPSCKSSQVEVSPT